MLYLRALLTILSAFAACAPCAAIIEPARVAGVWVTDPVDPKRGGEYELILQPDSKNPEILHIHDSTPVSTVYRGKYLLTGDTMTKLPNGRAQDPYRELGWRLENDGLIVTNGGVWKPKEYVGTRLIRLLPDPFFDAVRASDIKALKSRADLRKDIMGLVDQIGRTALYVATVRCQPTTLRLLLDSGAPVDLQNRNLWGDSALFAAVRRGDPECLSLLLERGTDVNQRSGNGRTPLMAAGESCGHYGLMLEILLEAGADPTATNAAGLTARDVLEKAGAKSFILIYDEQLAAYRQKHPNILGR